MNPYAIPGVTSVDLYSQEDLKIDIANYYGFDPKFMTHKSRKEAYVEARYMAFYYMKMYFGYSLVEAGALLGGRDHSTGSHALKYVDGQYAVSGSFKKKFEELSAIVTPKIKRVRKMSIGKIVELQNVPYADDIGRIIDPKKQR